MAPRRYVATYSLGGWRSVPWPFGIFEIEDGTLSVRSLHCGWWVSDRVIPRGEVEAIQVVNLFGVMRFRITARSGRPVKVLVGTRGRQRRATDELRRLGYLAT